MVQGEVIMPVIMSSYNTETLITPISSENEAGVTFLAPIEIFWL